MDAEVLRYLYPPQDMTREQLETVVEELRADCAAFRMACRPWCAQGWSVSPTPRAEIDTPEGPKRG